MALVVENYNISYETGRDKIEWQNINCDTGQDKTKWQLVWRITISVLTLVGQDENYGNQYKEFQYHN